MVYKREWYLANRDKVDTRNRKWRTKNPDKIKQFNFKTKLKLNYGLSYEDYLILLKTQDNACAICGEASKLVVDHCHSNSKVRGLLCSRCNLGLGQFQDSSKLLIKAIDYLDDKKDQASDEQTRTTGDSQEEAVAQ